MTDSTCGCWSDTDDTLHFCPLHAAARDLLAALEILTTAANVDAPDPLIMFASIERARAAIRKAKGDA